MCLESTFIFLDENIYKFHNVSSRISKLIYWDRKWKGKIFDPCVVYGTDSMILSYNFVQFQQCHFLLIILDASQLIGATKSFKNSTSQSLLHGTLATWEFNVQYRREENRPGRYWGKQSACLFLKSISESPRWEVVLLLKLI